MASGYTDLDLFVADLALESPEEESDDGEGRVTLSTVHSAKGLEWNAVLIIDLVEDRFPSRHALARPEDFEEERRLMYVACTRARQNLDLYVPATLYSRAERGSQHVSPSPFVRELAPGLVEEWVEGFGGALTRREAGGMGFGRKTGLGERPPVGCGAADGRPGGRGEGLSAAYADCPRPPEERAEAPAGAGATARATTRQTLPAAAACPTACGTPPSGPAGERAEGPAGALCYCRHRIFGRGKIVKELPPDKVQVNFPGFGLKVILREYLLLEG
jgi:DNA helicase-2/ATP-dependent DNA helicase PcrA